MALRLLCELQLPECRLLYMLFFNARTFILSQPVLSAQCIKRAQRVFDAQHVIRVKRVATRLRAQCDLLCMQDVTHKHAHK